MEVTYIDHMGNDLSVVNAARVSFSKRSDWIRNENDAGVELSAPRLSKGDISLIQFLARGCTSHDWTNYLDEIAEEGWNLEVGEFTSPAQLESLVEYLKAMPTHWTPFGHTAISIHCKAPIYIARQLGKHQVGFVWNEVSRRYVADPPTFDFPTYWRQAAPNVKQGSLEEPVAAHVINDNVARQECAVAASQYHYRIKQGLCAEQARMMLPQNMNTEWIWTGNLYAFANLYVQRSNPHAQKEVREFAYTLREVIEPLFPISWEALT